MTSDTPPVADATSFRDADLIGDTEYITSGEDLAVEEFPDPPQDATDLGLDQDGEL